VIALLEPISPVRAFRVLVRWRFLQMRAELPQILLLQVVVATGTGVGLGFLLPRGDRVAGAYVATGAILLNLFIIAVVMVPQVVAQSKASGEHDYMWSLPVARLAHPLAELVLWTAVIVPGMLVAFALTSLRFDLDLDVSPLIVPAVMLTLLTGTAVGTAIGLKAKSPQMMNLFTNAVLMLVLLFSPVNFPAERLPGWLQAIHDVLPIGSMADLVRGALLAGYEADVARDLVTLGIWATVGIFVTVRTVNRTT
jgi:ABC-2 type transport system permease protein